MFYFSDKLELTYSRSSGPGGQNINKVSTKVSIRFQLDKADWIPEVVRKNMLKKVFIYESMNIAS